MPDPGSPPGPHPGCSKHAAPAGGEAEQSPRAQARSGAQRRRPPTGPPLPRPRTPGDRHRPRHPPVHRGGRARRGGHRGVCLLLARLRGRPGLRRDRDHRPAGAGDDRRPGLRQLDGGAVRRPAPGAGPLPGPLAARAGHRRDPHRQHGPGLVTRSVAAVVAAWPAASLAGSYELLVLLIRTSGRQHAGRRQSASAMVFPAVLRRVLSPPQPQTAIAPQRASATRQTRPGGPRVTPPGTRPSPPTGSVTMRSLRPALSMRRRWPRTGSACGPANPLSERRLRPDVRAHLPPLGASQNRRCTASIAVPRLVGHPGTV